MKKYRDLSVKVKVPLMMGAAGFVVLALIFVLLLRPLRESALEDSAAIARVTAVSAAERLREEIGSQASVMRAYCDIIVDLAESGTIRNDRRRQFLVEGVASLVDNGKLQNAWILMEPNSLDGCDSLFAGKVGNTKDGAIAAWFFQGKIRNSDNAANTNLLRQIKASRQEIITEPYLEDMDGTEMQIMSVCVPIISGKKFYGIIGTDFIIDDLYNKVAALNTIGQGKLISSNGIAAVTYIRDLIGKQAEDGNRDILDRIPEGKTFEGFWPMRGVMQYKVYIPVQLIEGGKPWFYAVDVPYDTVFKGVRNITFNLMLYCLIGVVLIALAGGLLMQPIIKRVGGLTGIIKTLALGNTNLEMDSKRTEDELGVMNNELGNLVEGLRRSTQFAQRIGEGKLEAEFSLLSADDKLGSSLLEMRNSLQKANTEQAIRAKEEEQRNWGTSGLAKFADILRSDNDDMAALSANIVSNMVKYLGANQGGLFVLNDTDENDKFLEMTGCYAFDRKKYTEKRVNLGEGLVGTCFLEGEPIYMTNVPNEYINITSGLGDANPRALFICPLKLNDNVLGVIELASFTPFEPYQREFVEKVSESIASTITSVRITVRTNYLLEQSKMQAEQMVNSEEELRQNMEEMQATQEESRRRELELEETLTRVNEMQAIAEEKDFQTSQFHDAIFATSNMVEISADAIITDINENATALFGAPKSAFVGQHMSAFTGDEVYRKAMQSLNAGRIYENIQVIEVGGRSRTLIQRLIPIQDRNGKLLRITELVFPDDTAELNASLEKAKEAQEAASQSEEEVRQNLEEMRATQDQLEKTMKMSDEKGFETKQIEDLVYRAFNIVIFDSKGTLIDINENTMKLFGSTSKNDFVGHPMSDFLGREEYAKVMEHFGRGQFYENLQTINAGGTTVTLAQKFTPIKDTKGNLLRGMVLTYLDESTELRKREAVLNDALQRAKEAQEAASQSEEEVRQNMEEIKATQDELETKEFQTQQFQKAIFATCNTVELNSDAVITDINENCLALFGGAPKAAFVGKHMKEIAGDEVFKAAMASLTAGKIYENVQVIEAAGKSRTLIQRFIPIQEKTGKLLRITMLIFPDDTAELSSLLQKAKEAQEASSQAEEEVRQNLEEIKATQDELETKEFQTQQFQKAIFATCNTVELNADAVITDINDNCLALFGGAPKTAFVGKHMKEIAGDEVFKAAMVSLNDGKIYENVQTIEAAGKSRTLIQRFIPIQEKTGKLLRITMLIFPDDTAELRQSEEELRQSMEEMKAIQEDLANTMAVNEEKGYEMKQVQNLVFHCFNVVQFDKNGILINVNENCMNLFGVTDRNAFVGKPMEAFLGKEESEKVMAHLLRGEYYENVQEITAANGKVTLVQKFTPIMDSKGNLLRGTCVNYPDESAARNGQNAKKPKTR